MKTYNVIVKVELEGEFQVQAFDAEDAIAEAKKASHVETEAFDVKSIGILDVIEQQASI